jgi:hypothetical protein
MKSNDPFSVYGYKMLGQIKTEKLKVPAPTRSAAHWHADRLRAAGYVQVFIYEKKVKA